MTEETTKNKRWKFILFLILGIIPLIIVGFTIPSLCAPFTETVVCKTKDFHLKHAGMNEGEYEYELILELKFNKENTKLILTFDFKNSDGIVTDKMHLGSFEKGGERFVLKFTLKDDDYKLKNLQYKVDPADEFGKLYSSNVLIPAGIDVIMLVAAWLLLSQAFKSKQPEEGEESTEEGNVAEIKVKDAAPEVFVTTEIILEEVEKATTEDESVDEDNQDAGEDSNETADGVVSEVELSVVDSSEKIPDSLEMAETAEVVEDQENLNASDEEPLEEEDYQEDNEAEDAKETEEGNKRKIEEDN